MKLVTEYLTAGEAEVAAANLEAAGIATYVSIKGAFRLPVALGPVMRIGVWVVIDDQLWDAQQLLENPDHIVQSRLSESERQAISASIDDHSKTGALGILFKLLGGTVLFALAVYTITQT